LFLLSLQGIQSFIVSCGLKRRITFRNDDSSRSSTSAGVQEPSAARSTMPLERLSPRLESQSSMREKVESFVAGIKRQFHARNHESTSLCGNRIVTLSRNPFRPQLRFGPKKVRQKSNFSFRIYSCFGFHIRVNSAR